MNRHPGLLRGRTSSMRVLVGYAWDLWPRVPTGGAVHHDVRSQTCPIARSFFRSLDAFSYVVVVCHRIKRMVSFLPCLSVCIEGTKTWLLAGHRGFKRGGKQGIERVDLVIGKEWCASGGWNGLLVRELRRKPVSWTAARFERLPRFLSFYDQRPFCLPAMCAHSHR